MKIKSMIKKIIPKVLLDKKIHITKQLINFKTLSKTYNQYRSITNWECIDSNNNPIPWYTYPSIEYLSNLDFSNKRVLEWGSGNSSLFWAKRAKEVVSIENDQTWFDMINSKKLNNQSIYLQNADNGGGLHQTSFIIK